MEQQEYAEKQGEDAGPDHREKTENYEEHDRRRRQLDELALDRDHQILLRVRSTCTPKRSIISDWV